MEALQRQEEQRDQSKLVNDLRNKFVNFPIGRMLLTLIKEAPAESRPQLTIQLFGKAGHGKSELVNSCLCVARDEPYKNKCGATDCTGAVTRKREMYTLTRNIRICDNRGLKCMTSREFYEMEQQLKGKRDDLSKDVNFETSFFGRLFAVNTVKEKPGNVYVPVIVYKCDSHYAEDQVPELVPLIKIIINVSAFAAFFSLGKRHRFQLDHGANCRSHDLSSSSHKKKKLSKQPLPTAD
ncbi:uncharacterized protein LOC122798622 isoform X2 [Protopterus annectens]|uniref:uncharacterized protein LOC122798622 isoform X2 n=1 Tax=Protopterus annectens TaxID=7888 RepID=UPI001CFA08C4|nr:uncharacterized protein LOC122798622 isoform X2 [Protopterus annectens]